MSVVKSKRSIPKTEVQIKAKQLVEYTLLITSNKNIFNKFDSLINDINHITEQIYIDLYAANNIYVKDTATHKNRNAYQERAIINIKNLLGLIDLAWGIYHLRQNKVAYWAGLVLELRNKL